MGCMLFVLFAGSADAAAELRKELQTLRQRVETLEMELKTKDDDIKRLSKQQMPEQNRSQDERIKVSETC